MNLSSVGETKRSITVKNIHKIIYLILLHAAFISFSSPLENMKRKIALKKAYIHHQQIISTIPPKRCNTISSNPQY